MRLFATCDWQASASPGIYRCCSMKFFGRRKPAVRRPSLSILTTSPLRRIFSFLQANNTTPSLIWSFASPNSYNSQNVCTTLPNSFVPHPISGGLFSNLTRDAFEQEPYQTFCAESRRFGLSSPSHQGPGFWLRDSVLRFSNLPDCPARRRARFLPDHPRCRGGRHAQH